MEIKRIPNKFEYKPVTIQIVLETQEEYDAVFNMSGLNMGIPTLVNNEFKDINYTKTVKSFLDKLRNAL